MPSSFLKAIIFAAFVALVLSLGGCAVYGNGPPYGYSGYSNGYYEAQPGYVQPFSGYFEYYGGDDYGDYDHGNHDRHHFYGGRPDFDDHSYYHGSFGGHGDHDHGGDHD